MKPNRWVVIEMLCKVPYERHKDWSEQTDMAFHGPAGDFHNPEAGRWVTKVYLTTENKASAMKYNLFTEDGGI